MDINPASSAIRSALFALGRVVPARLARSSCVKGTTWAGPSLPYGLATSSSVRQARLSTDTYNA
jgi:hypothetical protein